MPEMKQFRFTNNLNCSCYSSLLASVLYYLYLTESGESLSLTLVAMVTTSLLFSPQYFSKSFSEDYTTNEVWYGYPLLLSSLSAVWKKKRGTGQSGVQSLTFTRLR